MILRKMQNKRTNKRMKNKKIKYKMSKEELEQYFSFKKRKSGPIQKTKNRPKYKKEIFEDA